MRLFTWTVAIAAVAGCETLKSDPTGSLPLSADADPAGAGEAAGLSLVEIGGPGVFTSPVALAQAPDGRLFVADQIGIVQVIDQDGVQFEPLLDLRNRIVPLQPAYDERGLLGLALHPNFADNGKIYVFYSAPLRTVSPRMFDHTNILSEFTLTDDDPIATERRLLQIDHPYPNNNGGTVAFGPDGLLYVSVGDGGNVGDEGIGHERDGNAQSRTSLLGKVLRLDVGAGDSLYGVPDTNPFVSGDGHPLVFAYGLRNPYRFSFDREKGDLWLVDSGQALMEEIDILQVGGNYGWNVREGFLCYNADQPTSPLDDCPDTGVRGVPFLDPVAAFVRTPYPGPEGETFDPAGVPGTEGFPQLGLQGIGGFVYRGSALEGHAGRYFFGSLTNDAAVASGKLLVSEDRGAGRIVRAAIVDAFPEPTRTLDEPPADSPAYQEWALPYFVLGLGEDLDGELYVLVNETLGPRGNTGRVFQLVATEP